MRSPRNMSYKKHWHSLVLAWGTTCFYCYEEPATTIDHIIPYSYSINNDPENLVLACSMCNCIAGNKVFDDVEHKRQYILGRRKSKKLRRTICTVCLLPYAYLEHSPSLFLCAECYDEEYETGHSGKKGWDNWRIALDEAGHFLDAHDRLRGISINVKESRIELLKAFISTLTVDGTNADD